MGLSWRKLNSLREIGQNEFLKLGDPKSGLSTPFLSYEYLSALEDSDSVGTEQTGWFINHICVFENERVVAFIPGYEKYDSYGEYVFDHTWANAYMQHGYAYFPKLVIAIPFTPVTGSRYLLAADCDEALIESYIASIIPSIIDKAKKSSCHILFPNQTFSDSMLSQNMMQRLSVQFIWNNHDYSSFDSFAQTMTSRRRKSIRKERNALLNTGITIKQLTDTELTQEVKTKFYLCYQQTYLKRSGHNGYLTKTFFDIIFETMKDQILIVAAFKGDDMIAGALFFYNQSHLFGRYWGALESVSGLHFECCYYQGIEFAINRKLSVFNPGTQGEHKILRGFEPTLCYSNHYIAHPDFRKAINDYLEEESKGIALYKERASTLLPFKTRPCSR